MAQRIGFDLLASTQDEAIRLVREGAPAGVTVVARRQHRGRGRLDHGWSSPSGGLYLSSAVPEPRFDPGLLPVGIGARLSCALHERYAIGTRIKWPNDVLVPGSDGRPRKLAGILVDRVLSPTFGVALVVGVGLNASSARSEFPPELAGHVAILSELAGRTVEPDEVEPLVLDAIAQTAERLNRPEGRRGVLEECRAALYGVGQRVRIDGHSAGVIRDLAEDGALLVEREGVLESIRAGEVVLEEAVA